MDYDVIVVGGGNAALCAALSAGETVKKVLVLERAPEEESGGNSRFTAGLFRLAYNGPEDLKTLIPDLSADEIANTDFGTYTEEQFLDDMARLTEYRCDPDLTEILVKKSLPTAQWMRKRGVRFTAAWGRQAFKIGGKFKFWGGLTVEAVGGGPGLVESETQLAKKAGIDIWYQARALELIADDDGVHGVVVRKNNKTVRVESRAVVLAAGGFQANTEWRTRYMGPGWELAKVRGTRFNTGDAIRMALDIGAQPWGHWSGCHAVQWDLNAPWHGDRKVGDNFQKHSYPLGLMVNLKGERFVDEGADFRNYTYVKFGRTVIGQPKRTAFQIFDQKVVHLLREEYRIREVTKAEDQTIEGLAKKLEIDVEGLVKTVADFNAAVMQKDFNPAIKDGKGTKGITPPKSNWALPLDTPPYLGFAVTTGISFTFGGLHITPDAQVIDTELKPMRGLYAAGELVGGLFYHNYPGGSGLMAGGVFGRIAGRSAALSAKG